MFGPCCRGKVICWYINHCGRTQSGEMTHRGSVAMQKVQTQGQTGYLTMPWSRDAKQSMLVR
jgi:hypothetical protein